MIREKSGKDSAKLPKRVIAVAPPRFRRERALIKRGVWPVAGGEPSCDGEGVMGRDGLVISIAGATISAKAAGDRLRCKRAEDCPAYGLEPKKGYAVPEHREVLTPPGPPLLRRRFFAPVAAA